VRGRQDALERAHPEGMDRQRSECRGLTAAYCQSPEDETPKTDADVLRGQVPQRREVGEEPRF